MEGVQENSKRHAYMLNMLGIKQLCVLINKMDLINYDEKKYSNIVSEFKKYLNAIKLEPLAFIPISAKHGYLVSNKVDCSQFIPWYKGKSTFEMLDNFSKEPPPYKKPLRIPIQDIYKFTNNNDDRRIFVGKLESGEVKAGDNITFYPSNKTTTLKSIENFGKNKIYRASTNSCIGFTISKQVYIQRGEIATKSSDIAPIVSDKIKANIFWLGKQPLEKGKSYIFKLATCKTKMTIEKINYKIDAQNLSRQQFAAYIKKHEIAECVIKLKNPIAFDTHNDNYKTSRFVIIDNFDIAGGGIITSKEESCAFEKTNKNVTHIKHPAGKVLYQDRIKKNQHEGFVLWITGLSGSGKSTVAIELEKILFDNNYQVCRLDGDSLRSGLNSDLQFSEIEREENVRRTAEMAKILKNLGFIVIVSLISPTNKMRFSAKEIIGNKNFTEIYMNASLETCKIRDTKNLYTKAANKTITDFTGIDQEYEIPTNPNIILDTEKFDIKKCTDDLLKYLQKHKKLIKKL